MVKSHIFAAGISVFCLTNPELSAWRHLKLLGVRVRSFNAGELRRESGKAGIEAPLAGLSLVFLSMSGLRI